MKIRITKDLLALRGITQLSAGEIYEAIYEKPLAQYNIKDETGYIWVVYPDECEVIPEPIIELKQEPVVHKHLVKSSQFHPSRREYFAAQTLSALLSNAEATGSCDEFVEHALQYADEMIRQLDGSGKK